ncbi:zinc finger protein 423-like isoform X2 [Limulus polyphemus]|uniref:Zinc finger protein 423-like isoform X2 n=1 Tax=Limulus polyphemus TaxID=6850 RepID=A0ABM1BQ88_LIMPO|nr:zinc finger protein 423-like isoform X2 [Limulus polyphemus]
MKVVEPISGITSETKIANCIETSDPPQNSMSSLVPSDRDDDVAYTVGRTNSTSYCCHYCDKTFPRVSLLKRHEQIHSGILQFKCDYCQRLFKHKRSRDRHIKLHTGDKRYRCQHCESAFSRSDHLKIHMKTHDNAKPFQCTVCNRGYNTAAALTSHMQSHKKERTPPASLAFRCLFCSKSFSSSQELKNHTESHREDPNDMNYCCVFCSLVYPSFDALKVHLEQHHRTENQHKCSLCQETFHSTDDLLAHKKSHEDRRRKTLHGNSKVNSLSPKLECGFCSKSSFSSLEALQLHVQAIHVPPSRDFFHFSRVDVLEHIQLQSLDRRFNCKYCHMKFNDLYKLQKHSIDAHTTSAFDLVAQENFYCSQCTMRFSNVAQLTEHVKTVHETPVLTLNISKSKNNEYQKDTNSKILNHGSTNAEGRTYNLSSFSLPLLCVQCNTPFPDFETFRTHQENHQSSEYQMYKCSECHSSFLTEEQLGNHVINHFLAKTTEYGCQCCLKLFSKPDELQKHLLEIHALPLYRCSLCRELFDSKVSIQAHFSVQHSHENIALKCTSCNAVFCSELDFQFHVKVAHLFQLRQFYCLLCNQSFSTEVLLGEHLNTHKKQYPCGFCGENFHVEYLLDKHVQTRHLKDSVPLVNVTSDQPISSSLCDLPSDHPTIVK